MMEFNLKELLIFFLIFVVGGFIGGYVNDYFGLGQGTGIFAYMGAMFVPVLIAYLIWKNYGQKAAKG